MPKNPAPDYTRRMKTTRCALLLLSFVLVAACGTKGDLVLPDKATPAGTAAPAATPDAAEQTEPPAGT